jgi:hypothetical protein
MLKMDALFDENATLNKATHLYVVRAMCYVDDKVLDVPYPLPFVRHCLTLHNGECARYHCEPVNTVS